MVLASISVLHRGHNIVTRSFLLLLVLSLVSRSVSLSKTFSMNARVSLKPEFRDEFLRIMKHNAKETLEKEPGALTFTLGEDPHETNVFFFHTRYTCQADFEHHKTTPHFAAYKTFSAFDPYAERAVVQFFECPGPATNVRPPRAIVCRDIELCIKPAFRKLFLTFLEEDVNGQFDLDSVLGESTKNPNCLYLHEECSANQTPRKFWEDFEARNALAKPAVVNEYCNMMCQS